MIFYRNVRHATFYGKNELASLCNSGNLCCISTKLANSKTWMKFPSVPKPVQINWYFQYRTRLVGLVNFILLKRTSKFTNNDLPDCFFLSNIFYRHWASDFTGKTCRWDRICREPSKFWNSSNCRTFIRMHRRRKGQCLLGQN